MTRKEEIIAFFNDPDKVRITVPMTPEVKEQIKKLARRYIAGAHIPGPPRPTYPRPKLACEARKA